MTNTIIQDKLGFIALEGARDILYENRMVSNRRLRLKAQPIVGNKGVDKEQLRKNSIQLRLF